MLEIFAQLIYEYKKGVRDLILYTCSCDLFLQIEDLLKKNKIHYLIQNIGNGKINIFFGAVECIEILKNFSTGNLSKLTKEEDFILGIMLGYSRKEQYNRLLSKV